MAEQTIVAELAPDISPQLASAQLAALAQQVLDETDAFDTQAIGKKPPSRTYVDGAESAPLSSVKPNGVIAREYDLVPEAIPLVWEMLQAASPRLTGRYAASHTLFVDGSEFFLGGADTPSSEIPLGQVYIFASVVPYARKLEKLDEVYENVARAAARQFGNSVSIKFTYFSVSGSPEAAKWLRKMLRKHPGGTRRQRRQKEDWFARQPAIQITVR